MALVTVTQSVLRKKVKAAIAAASFTSWLASFYPNGTVLVTDGYRKLSQQELLRQCPAVAVMNVPTSKTWEGVGSIHMTVEAECRITTPNQGVTTDYKWVDADTTFADIVANAVVASFATTACPVFSYANRPIESEWPLVRFTIVFTWRLPRLIGSDQQIQINV